jgi:SAM-dependent methyltransferase
MEKIQLLSKFHDLWKKLPTKYKNFLWISIAGLRLKALFWRFHGSKLDIYTELGYHNCKKLFGISSGYHKKILKEADVNIRETLYNKLYEAIYDFVKKHLPESETFGFKPDLINDHADLFKNKTVIDYGCGMGVSTRLLSKYAKFVYGIDASSAAVRIAKDKATNLQNVEFRLNAGPFVSFENGTIDSVYSNDLLEHLHPADLNFHLEEIYRILKDGGKYLFWTPGSKSGPHDITQCFYPRGMGFKPKADHIKEYTFSELITIIQEIGYKKIELPDLKREVLMIVTK